MTDEMSADKEKQYQNYDSNSSKKLAGSAGKPNFKLDFGKLPGITPQAATAPSMALNNDDNQA